MAMTTLRLHPSWVIDEVSPFIFGGFLEHMGRAVYEGVYEPGSAHADADDVHRIQHTVAQGRTGGG